MTDTQQKLLDACRKRHMASLEWERVDREGESFPRQLAGISSEIELRLVDIEIYTSEMVGEEQ